MTRPPRRHGTKSMYSAGCRCTDCRAANAATVTYHRRIRAHGIPSTLTPRWRLLRRVRALQALGWPLAEIARQYNGHETSLNRAVATSNPTVTLATLTSIDRVYRALCMTPGPSHRTRQYAAAQGWKPPLAWDDIDDPREAETRRPQRWAA